MDEKRFELSRTKDGAWSVIDRRSGEVAFVDGILFEEIALDVAKAAIKVLNSRPGAGLTFH
ncbi:hypothetical protein ACLE20_04860 [Rhizobium sp. YIM 134829]|uniref:hypothetical protein n=1 Tax=Rhizobium sp. YIM 134829 TaxID=3390453 RepID=UPI00397E4966